MRTTRMISRRYVRDASRSEYFNDVYKYFDRHNGFGFGNFIYIADDIVSCAMEYEGLNEDNVYDAVCDAIDNDLVYYDDQWNVLKYYCVPSEANWEKALDEFTNDIANIVSDLISDREPEEE